MITAQTILGLVPLVAFLLCALAVGPLRHRIGVGDGIRERLVVASLLCGAWTVLGTELLSLATALTFLPVLLWWFALILVVAVFLSRKAMTRNAGDSPMGLLGFGVGAVRSGRRSPPEIRQHWAVVLLLFLTVLAGVPALLAPPNNHDVLSYHLPRQVYWIDHGTVAHYASHDMRQVMMPPFAEFVGAHVMLLSGGDRWCNLIQWFALVIAMCVVSLIVRQLNGPRAAQLLAALFVITNPIAFMQASNGKNDLVVGVWAATAVWLAMKVWAERRVTGSLALLAGGAVGLLVLTKGTGLLFVPVLVVLLGGALLRCGGWHSVRLGTLVVATALALNAGHLGRNQSLFGSPTGPTTPEAGRFTLSNEVVSFPALSSNVVRNMMLHLGTSSDDFNRWVMHRVEQFHTWLGISSSDPRTTYPYTISFDVKRFPFSEDTAPAPLHLVVALSLPFLTLLARGRRKDAHLWVSLLAACASFVIFCLVLKWQPWHARFHIAMFVLLAPAAGTVLAELGLSIPTAALSILILLPSALWNQARPLLGSKNIFVSDRPELMFLPYPELRPGTLGVDQWLATRRPASIGFRFVRWGDWVYPLQRMALDHDRPHPRLAEFNPSWARAASRFDIVPDVVIATAAYSFDLVHQRSGVVFIATNAFPPFVVYERGATAPRESTTLQDVAFFGWDWSDGLDVEEGPYPQWDLPLVRWGIGPRTTLIFRCSKPAAELVLDGRSNGHFNQGMTVKLNGELVDQVTFRAPFESQKARLMLATRPGDNELTLEYSKPETVGYRVVSVLFRKLVIRPFTKG